MIEVHSDHTQSIVVKATPDEAYERLSDVPWSVAHFPDLQDLQPGKGDNAYTWFFKPIGAFGVSVQIKYTNHYTCDPERRSIEWVSRGEGETAGADGSWTIEPAGDGTKITLKNVFHAQLPAPRLMRRPVEAFVASQNGQMIDKYLANIQRSFAGEDGRVNRWSAFPPA